MLNTKTTPRKKAYWLFRKNTKGQFYGTAAVFIGDLCDNRRFGEATFAAIEKAAKRAGINLWGTWMTDEVRVRISRELR
jgi:hypothetical protein